MNILSKISDFGHIHFVGIGGISMSGLAAYALSVGCRVTGSDKEPSELTKELEKAGAVIRYRHSARNVKKADLVVYTSAISEDNPELKKALGSGIPVIKRSGLLEMIMREYKDRIAVAGSHGKTTATAMITRVLYEGGLDPTAFIGGEDKRFSNCLKGNGEVIVTEACEYKKNFLDLSPSVSVVLNVDNDHMESYGSMTAMKQAFTEFTAGTLAVVNADDVGCEELQRPCSVSFGIKSPAVYSARKIKKGKKGYSFTVFKHEKRCVRVNLSVIGRHNIYNALAAFAVADLFKVRHCDIKRALESFDGVKRRYERLGELFGAEVYADYAHHPEEISATLKAFGYSSDDLVVFQPHTYSRTKLLMEEFVACFKGIENLVIYKTYPAREKFDRKGDGVRLTERLISAGLNNCSYAKDRKTLLSGIKKHGGFSRMIFLGAGDIYSIVNIIIKENQNQKNK